MIVERVISDLVISGFSGGSGKTFLAHKILKHMNPLMEFSVSTTTRLPRGNDKDGEDYNFVSVETFQTMIKNGEFLEFNNPREGIYYGTTRKEYNRIKSTGKAVIFDVDYEGVRQLRATLGKDFYAVLLKPTLETRVMWMEKRGDMTAEEIVNRKEYSEDIEKKFFKEFELVLFDKIVDPYLNDVNLIPFLINEIENAISSVPYHRV
jgi:guanylate kinase